MSMMASQITSLMVLFTQPFIQAQIKENIKALRHWPLWGEFPAQRASKTEKFPFHDLIMLACQLMENHIHSSQSAPFTKMIWLILGHGWIITAMILCGLYMITYLYLNFNDKSWAWMSNYIPLFFLYMIIYPSHNSDAGLVNLYTGAPYVNVCSKNF